MAEAPRIALTICAVPGSRPLRLLISASFRAPATAPEAKPAPVAHDAANSRMHGNLSPASVILHVVGKTECLLTEDRGKFLLLLDLLLVKDSAKLIEGHSLCHGSEQRCPASDSP